MDRMQAYARDDEVAARLREKIESIEGNLMEELKTSYGATKFEFFGTMFDGLDLMGLGASSFGKL